MIAPELRVASWIDSDGRSRPPLTLAELGTGYKVIFCFQHWCEGCHVTGFPALKQLVEELGDVGFAAVQTVFEGFDTNTADRLRDTQLRYGLKIPFGQDGAKDDDSTVLLDFQIGGTPWFIVIDPAGKVIHCNFQIDVDRAITRIRPSALH